MSIDPENDAVDYLSLLPEVTVDAGIAVMSDFNWGPASEADATSHDDGADGTESESEPPETDPDRSEPSSGPEAPDGGTTESPDGETTETPDGGRTEPLGSEETEPPGSEETEPPDTEETEPPDGDRPNDPAATADPDELRGALTELGEATEQLGGTVESIRADLDTLEARVDEDVEDLRERVVRIYRDVEKKAPEEHSHPETADRLDGLVDEYDELSDRLDTIADAIDDVGEIDDRIADVESRVDELAGTADDVSGKLSRVASAVVRTQRRLRAVEHDRAERKRLDGILAEANRHGVGKAECAGCGNTVRLSLLSKPECPYCESRFDELEPATRFYRTSRLTVDDRPALEGGVAANPDGRASGDPNESADRNAGTDGTDDAAEADRDDDNPAGREVSTRESGATDSTDGSDPADAGSSAGEPGRTDPEGRDGS